MLATPVPTRLVLLTAHAWAETAKPTTGAAISSNLILKSEWSGAESDCEGAGLGYVIDGIAKIIVLSDSSATLSECSPKYHESSCCRRRERERGGAESFKMGEQGLIWASGKHGGQGRIFHGMTRAVGLCP